MNVPNVLDPSPRGANTDVRSVVAAATRRLAAAGCDTPRLDAELLVAGALQIERAAVLTHPAAAVPPGAEARVEELIARRVAREPVAYVLGRRGFRHIELRVDPRVLIPRPETELLVEAALGLPTGAAVQDVGTGSGAVALALKHERPDLRVSGSDTSADAIEVARANARRLGLDVEFRLADLLDGAVAPDAVVANLPYVADPDIDHLQPEIVRHEPREALAAGPDGLLVLRRLIAQAGRVPFVALEVGAGQASAVRDLLRAAWTGVRTLRDLAGIERVVVARRG